MSDNKLNTILESLSALTIEEAALLSKKMEDAWGVSAAAPVAAAAGPAAQQEKTTFDVKISAIGDKKIDLIKEVRAITALGLKEAKDLVEGLGVVKAGASKDEAESLKAKLVAAGASVELK